MNAEKPLLNVGIFVYEQVEELDFVGPLETFSVAGRKTAGGLKVFTVAERPDILATSGNLLVKPHYTFADHPQIDILVLPGGDATGQSKLPSVVDWLARVTASATLNTSVCSGALMLARVGLLDGRPATTHHLVMDQLIDTYPSIELRRDVRWVDNGDVITSAGISAGIDMSLHVVRRFLGEQVAVDTALYMEYPWPGSDR